MPRVLGHVFESRRLENPVEDLSFGDLSFPRDGIVLVVPHCGSFIFRERLVA